VDDAYAESGIIHFSAMPDHDIRVVCLPLLTAVGPLCSTRQDGEKINRMVTNLLNMGHSVTLDFHGVKLVTPSFYSAAFADLYCTFPEEEVSARVTINEMPVMQLFRW
jgi:hypothetical protein